MNNNLPERSCIICRAKKDKPELFRIVKNSETSYSFDKDQKKDGRGYYICKSLHCLEKLSKHNKVKLDTNELMSMLNIINKSNKNYLNIINSMKNSGELVFGINLLFENIEKVHFIIMAHDINKKNEKKILNKAKELDIPYLYAGNREELGKIFDKLDVNVIGVKNKKIAKGLI